MLQLRWAVCGLLHKASLDEQVEDNERIFSENQTRHAQQLVCSDKKHFLSAAIEEQRVDGSLIDGASNAAPFS